MHRQATGNNDTIQRWSVVTPRSPPVNPVDVSQLVRNMWQHSVLSVDIKSSVCDYVLLYSTQSINPAAHNKSSSDEH